MVHGEGPTRAALCVVGMAPAREEVRLGRPFMGPSGQVLNDALRRAGCPRSEAYVTNLLDYPIPLGTSVFTQPDIAHHIARCEAEVASRQPNVVLLLGNDPVRAFLPALSEGTKGAGLISKWRGSILPARVGGHVCKAVPAMHPAFFVRGAHKWEAVFRSVDIPRAVAESRTRELRYPERRTLTAPTLREAVAYLENLRREPYVSFDIETTPGYQDIACVGFGSRVDEAICIPFVHKGSTEPYWSIENEVLIWKAIARLLQSDVPKIAQNAAFEWIHFWRNGIFPANLWIDTMTLHHCLYPDFGGTEDLYRKRDPNNPGHALAFINSQYTRTPFYKDEGRQWIPAYGDERFWRYNGMDVMVTLDIALQMWEEAKALGLLDIYKEYYIRPTPHANRMEWDGVKQNLAIREQVRKETIDRIALLQEYVRADLGHDLNVKSPKQMAEFLYVERGYAPVRHHKTKKITTNKDAIAKFLAQGDRTLEAIKYQQELRDFKGDILDVTLGPEGAIHTHYKIGGTNGARWSSGKSILGTGTNLQNIPRTGIARKLFLPG